MNHIYAPALGPVAINSLRPTQMTVGMREVHKKRQNWREHDQKDPRKASAFLGTHMVPVVIGPKKNRYVIDHHHLVRALHEEGVDSVLVSVVADLSVLEKDAFWVLLDNRGWIHPFDSKGRRCAYDDIPKSISGLTDDPYRSLAGEVRELGGYAKSNAPFSEFQWADFLRRRIKPALLRDNFEEAMQMAMALVKSHDANYLPGWSGPDWHAQS